jgi:cytochrome c oxidase assembly protein subunit 15
MLEHRIATVAVVATFLLLIIGGTVNPTGSSLACPEPTLVCHGELFPEMRGGVLYEHGHRQVAMAVGVLQIALTALLLRRRTRMRALAWLTLAMVCAQGTLGAFTVKYKLPWVVSTAHLMLAMAYLATLIYVVFRTRPHKVPRSEPPGSTLGTEVPKWLGRWILIAAGFVLMQILVGGLVRHHGAALACLDVPFCEGGGAFDWPPAGVQKLQMLHRTFGAVTALVTIAVAMLVVRRAAGQPRLRWLRRAAWFAPLLVLGQIALGVYTVLTLRAVPLAVAHFAVAAALWLLWITMYLTTRDIAPAEPVAMAHRRSSADAGAHRIMS